MKPRPQITFSLAVMASILGLTMGAAAEVRLPSLESSKLDATLAGRIWIEELNCVACHSSTAADLIASSRKAPRLAEVRGPIEPDFHFHNAETCMEAGLRLGWAMAELLAGKK